MYSSLKLDRHFMCLMWHLSSQIRLIIISPTFFLSQIQHCLVYQNNKTIKVQRRYRTLLFIFILLKMHLSYTEFWFDSFLLFIISRYSDVWVYCSHKRISAKAMGSSEAGMPWRAASFEVSIVTCLIPLSPLSSLASQRPSCPPQLLIMALLLFFVLANAYIFGNPFWSLCQDFTFVFYKRPSPSYFWCFKENVACALKLTFWIRRKSF